MSQFDMTIKRTSGKEMTITVVSDGMDVLETTFTDGEPFTPTQEQAEAIGQEVAERIFTAAEDAADSMEDR